MSVDCVDAVVQHGTEEANQPEAVHAEDLEGHKGQEKLLAVLPLPLTFAVLVYLDHSIAVQEASEEEHRSRSLHPAREVHGYTNRPLPKHVGNLVVIGVVVSCQPCRDWHDQSQKDVAPHEEEWLLKHILY